jgi:hypothetical protein
MLYSYLINVIGGKIILPLDEWSCILQLGAMRSGNITISLVAMLHENTEKEVPLYEEM